MSATIEDVVGEVPAPIYITLEEAFDAMNQRLFDGLLPRPVILIHRKLKPECGGYFSPGRWRARDADMQFIGHDEARARDAELWQRNCKQADKLYGDPNGWTVHEIALNPESWPYWSDQHVLSVLAHEMAHLWQHEFGKPSRSNYHNKEWGRKMKEIGLYPSDTGKPGGAETGQRMSHYIVEGEAFDLLSRELLADDVSIRLEAPKPLKVPRPKSKLKYSCPTCDQNAWAKPDARLKCGDCGETMKCEDDDDQAD